MTIVIFVYMALIFFIVLSRSGWTRFFPSSVSTCPSQRTRKDGHPVFRQLFLNPNLHLCSLRKLGIQEFNLPSADYSIEFPPRSG